MYEKNFIITISVKEKEFETKDIMQKICNILKEEPKIRNIDIKEFGYKGGISVAKIREN